MPLVEVVRGAATDDAAPATALAVGKARSGIAEKVTGTRFHR